MVDTVNQPTCGFRSRKFERRSVLAPVAIILVVAFATVWIHDDRTGRLYYTVVGTLGNFYRALEAYDDGHGHLPLITAPSADKHSISWRIEAVATYYGVLDSPSAEVHATDYDRKRPWNDPSNLRLQDTLQWQFMYRPTHGQRDLDEAYDRLAPEVQYLTYYRAITGTDTAFAPGVSHSLKELPNDLILIVRVEESNVHWMEPIDLLVEDLVSSEQSKYVLLGNNGYAVLFADGESWVLSSRLDYADLSKFFTIEGAKQFDRDTLLGAYKIQPWF